MEHYKNAILRGVVTRRFFATIQVHVRLSKLIRDSETVNWFC